MNALKAHYQDNKPNNVNGNDFQQWMYKLKLLLKEEQLYDVVFKSIPQPAAEPWVLAAWMDKDLKARRLINRTLANNQITRIQTAKSAKEVIERLQENYEPKGLAASFYHKKQIYMPKMEEGNSMQDHLNTVFDVVQCLATTGEIISERQVMLVILISLPSSYKIYSDILQNTRTQPIVP